MLQVINGPTIPAGESLSDAIDCRSGQLVSVTMPAAWSGNKTLLTFQLSNDGETFNELYGLDGYAVAIKEIVPNSSVIIPPDIGRAISFIRFRSGSEGNPEPQEEARVFSLVLFTVKATPVAVFKPKRKPTKPVHRRRK